MEEEKPGKRQRKVRFDVERGDEGLDPGSCIFLCPVSSAEEMANKSPAAAFPLDFTEHLFGEEGKIYGYKDLKVMIWFHALSFHTHIEISYAEKSAKRSTDVEKTLKEALRAGLVEDRDAFVQSISHNNQFRDILHQISKKIFNIKRAKDQDFGDYCVEVENEPDNVHKEILLLDLDTSEIKDWHSRLTPLVLMFIEGGRPIEQNDPQWEVLISLQKEPDNTWKLVGLCFVYNFFKYPDSTRLRISQILVFPPYQGHQNGLNLLKTVNRVAAERDCYEVTVEDPSESLQHLRDTMDVLRILLFEPARICLPRAIKQMLAAKDKFESCVVPPKLVSGVRKSLKISKGQLQRCWDVLLFLHLRGLDVSTLGIFKKWVTWRVHVELFGKSRKEDVDANKQILDTENSYNRLTFVMFKTRCSKNEGSKVDDSRVIEFVPENNGSGTDGMQELEELIGERAEEIAKLAEAVMKHFPSAGTSLVSWS